MRVIIPLTVNDTNLTDTNIPEDDYPVYDAGTTYAANDRVIYQHVIYRSRVASNTGNTPNVSSTQWANEGATNRYRAFDGKIGSQTVNEGEIVYELTPSQLVNSIAFFNLLAGSVRVELNDPNAGIVYDKIRTLVDHSAITNWYNYFFSPIVMATEISFLDLPAYPQAVVTVTIDNGENDAKVGEIIFGTRQFIGDALWGTSVGIIDFSTKGRDEFGNSIIVERPYSDRGKFPLKIDTSQVYTVKRILTSIRAKPTVFIGSMNRPETYIYGFAQEFEIILSGPDKSDCMLEVEGLT